MTSTSGKQQVNKSSKNFSLVAFRPDAASDSLLFKALGCPKDEVARKKCRGRLSKIINMALHKHLRDFAGKREQILMEGK